MNEYDYRLASASRAVAQGKISRRDFLQVAMAAGFTLSAAQGHVCHGCPR